MNSKAKPPELPMGDLIDRIAKALPAEVRADYYRELMHCRSLPENDEMLRILRVMQFLTLLMEEVPNRVVIERKRRELLFGAAVESLERAVRSSEAYQRQLDVRINHLPEAISKDLNPQVIAANINESLRQEFAHSTIPQTARALAAVARELKETTVKFEDTARSLGGAYHGAVTDATRSIKEMESSISRAANAARLAAAELSGVFRREYRWSVCVLSGLALVIGLALGILLQRWLDPPATEVGRDVAPAVQSAPPIIPKARP